jgi:hypothetical protein
MATPREIANLLEPLAAIQRLIDHFEQQGVVIGGVAVSLLSKPRVTAAVDAVLLLSLDEVPRLLEAAKQKGFIARISQPEVFARRSRVVLLRHETSGINADISLGVLPFEVEAVKRSQLHHINALHIRLPTPEDLIILKAVAHRPKDLLDIQALTQAHSKLDKKRIKHWVSEFAQLPEQPELWDDIAHWIEK